MLIVHTTFYLKRNKQHVSPFANVWNSIRERERERDVIPDANCLRELPIFPFSFERVVTMWIRCLITQIRKEVYMFLSDPRKNKTWPVGREFPISQAGSKAMMKSYHILKRGKNLEKSFNLMLKEGTTCKIMYLRK